MVPQPRKEANQMWNTPTVEIIDYIISGRFAYKTKNIRIYLRVT